MSTQMTVIEKRAQTVERAKNAMLADVEAHRSEIERFLVPLKVDYEFFVAGLRVFLMKAARENQDFFLKLTDTGSFIESLLRISMNGLIPDGKEAAIAVYAGVAQALFMRDGFVKVLWRTGLVKSINDQVVTVKEYETGRFEYVEGDEGRITHKMDLMRKDEDDVAAAYCVIKMASGEDMREVVPKDELEKIAKMSRSPARGAWKHQMHRKAAIRRIMGKMPRDAAIVQLLQHDEASYDLSKANAPAEDAPSHKELFGGKPIRKAKAKAKAEPRAIEQGADMVMELSTANAEVVAEVVREGEASDGALAEKIAGAPSFDAVKDAAFGEDEEEGVDTTLDTPFVLRAILTTRKGVQLYADDATNAEFWFGDVQQRMKNLSGAELAAFWKANKPYVEEAGRNGHLPLAMKLVALAQEMGVLQGGDDRG